MRYLRQRLSGKERETKVGFSYEIGPPPLNRSTSLPFASRAGITNHPSSFMGDLLQSRRNKREQKQERRNTHIKNEERESKKRIRSEHVPPLVNTEGEAKPLRAAGHLEVGVDGADVPPEDVRQEAHGSQVREADLGEAAPCASWRGRVGLGNGTSCHRVHGPLHGRYAGHKGVELVSPVGQLPSRTKHTMQGGYVKATTFSILERMGTRMDVMGFSANKARTALWRVCLFPAPSTATHCSRLSDKYRPISEMHESNGGGRRKGG